MEKHIQGFLRRVSLMCVGLGSLTLLLLVTQPPSLCLRNATTPFPTTSCEANRRHPLSPANHTLRLHSSSRSRSIVSSYATHFRLSLLDLGFLSRSSRVLCVSAGVGLPALALSSLGLSDVTAVEILESPPFVERADPHDLPFFDSIFDLAFSDHLADSLFPSRYAEEMQRTVRKGGFCVVAVDRCSDVDVRRIRALFRSSTFVGAWNVTFASADMTQLVLRVGCLTTAPLRRPPPPPPPFILPFS